MMVTVKGIKKHPSRTLARLVPGYSIRGSARDLQGSVMSETERELLALTQRLLDSITGGDWATYEQLCDPTLTAYEEEAPGQLVEGLAFHRFYFDLGGVRGKH